VKEMLFEKEKSLMKDTSEMVAFDRMVHPVTAGVT
jgi:hypothetical protein